MRISYIPFFKRIIKISGFWCVEEDRAKAQMWMSTHFTYPMAFVDIALYLRDESLGSYESLSNIWSIPLYEKIHVCEYGDWPHPMWNFTLSTKPLMKIKVGDKCNYLHFFIWFYTPLWLSLLVISSLFWRFMLLGMVMGPRPFYFL